MTSSEPPPVAATAESSPSASVTVVISTLHRPQQLVRCIDALLAGTRLPDEIVVVDQGDVVASAALLESRRSAGVPLVHVAQRRRGLSASQNEGVRLATSPVVSIIDDDCVPDPRWVEVAAREHARATVPLLIGGRVLALPPVGERTVALAERTSEERRVFPPGTIPWHVGTGGNFSVTRAAFLNVGGNDERLGTGTPGRAGNDLDLFHRLMRNGVQARFEPELLVYHERSTPAEFRSRSLTYGFGVGACVAVWLTSGDRSAWRALVGWLAMRARMLIHAPGSILEQGRVLVGTVQGLSYGTRLWLHRRSSGSLP